MSATAAAMPLCEPALGILHLTTYLQGGAGRAITDLACAQHAAGDRVTVVTSATASGEFGNYPEYLERLRAAGVTVRTCDSLFARDLALNMRVIEMLSRTVDVDALDVIHAHAAVPAFIARGYTERMGVRVPVVQTQHGWGSNKTPSQAAFDLDVLRRVDAVITTSRATADLLVGYGTPARSISVVPCGLSPAPAGPPPSEARRAVRLFRQHGQTVLGCIGSVTANKNQRLLIDAMHASGEPNWAALFVGEGGEALLDHARSLGLADRVAVVGYQPLASRWLPALDVLVVPSRTEGQGLVVLEAFRAGVPVVASRIAALAELIDDERNGFLFDTDDPGALASAIRRTVGLESEERKQLVAAGLARFGGEFTFERMVGRHDALYRSLARPARAGAAGAAPRATGDSRRR